ncbi:MAG: glutamine--tRNA ligase/YqeY domain fusion protein [Gammaproteobacteria bacterium]|nr:glutamine--tRNA ligase/YqeY domain fusion protein [Gammaproteobacteria bacterium]
MDADSEPSKRNFIWQQIELDLAAGRHPGGVQTRFPPEPNGYLHIGHAKSICLNFGTAAEFGGRCNLRFDDTNPETESEEFSAAITDDVHWLGFSRDQDALHASDYFEELYRFACELIERRLAYVDSLGAEETRTYRGTLTEPGRPSPFRDRSIEENLDLFRRMRAGEFAEGEHVLRARIDMASPNMNMRDPTLYRIRRKAHHRTADAWSIYPMYDFSHCISDALEGITHSLCTLEFEDHRPLYDWVLDNTSVPCHPQQIEFARLELNYTITSKRKLAQLVRDGHVTGWDDPRMPTIKGMRRRGIPAAAIRDFCDRVGVTKKDTQIDVGVLENSVREELDRSAPRAMAVLDPVRVIIDNYPEGQVDDLEAPNHPKDPAMGTRTIPFARELHIERDDFMEDPPKKFFRLAPGREVRLRYAYLVTCTSVVKNDDGEIVEIHCTYDPATRGGDAPDGRKVKGTIHWVSAEHGIAAEVRLFDRLFNVPEPAADDDFIAHLNPESLRIIDKALVEPALAACQPEERFQFERLGYFCADRNEHGAGRAVFNRTVSLRDTWARIGKG